ncbi:MAG TPA: ATP-dependent RNA helicase HrpA [Desulfobulbus sp.]|nr:ATP-dependent RNA helicase HrpA [Desulfobulbus sp.]
MNLNYPENLPITAEKDRIVAAIRKNQVLIIAGDTGSGKTTQLPKMCLDAGLGKEKIIGCTQPRRLAAVSMAERVSDELKRPDLVGSTVRFQDRTRESTRIKFMTDGILLAETRRDHLLKRYDTIIIDEAHERSLNIDFLLGYLKQLLPKRPELKLIIASATIDTEKFSSHFDNAQIFQVSGRTFPITVEYFEESTDEETNYVDQACEAVQTLCLRPGGDILVFMPTERDILDTMAALQHALDPARHLILPLFGRLQAGDQRKIFRTSKKRKIIVATNVAETSITVPGIRFVVDTGLARIPAYNVRARTSSLLVSRISRASCDQRSGRCGRTGPGTCLRLFSEEDYLGRAEFTRPEIQRSNLAEVILQMISLRLGDPRRFPFLDPPTPRAISDGFRQLHELGAIDSRDRLTEHGRIMARLPLDPRIARIIIEGAERNALRETTIICAALSIQDPRMRPAEKEKLADQAQEQFIDKQSDFLSLLNIWQAWQTFSKGGFSSSKLRKFCTAHYLSWQRMREWFDVHEQINRLLKPIKGFVPNNEPASYAAIHMALASGFLRNIGRKKEKNLYTVSGGREVTLFPGSCLYNKKNVGWIMAADFIETSRLFARTAAVIDDQWLETLGKGLCKYNYSDPHWSKRSGQVQALERVSLFGLPIVAGRKVNYGRINEKTAGEAREIFIHQGLIEGELSGRYPFLQHNLALIREISTMEERVRRRNILVDDQVLFQFYKERIGTAYDKFTLNLLLKKKKSDNFLWMNKEDICREMPEQDELYLYPKTLRAGEFDLPLHYHFQPGDEKDGVTVSLTRQQVSSLSPAPFEWLVPGLLDEKILYLCKRLPKKLRRRLVPLPDAVDRIMDRLDLYSGSLYPALEKALLREFQLIVTRSDWQTDTLPRHLLMRYQLKGENRKILCTTRSFTELLAALSDYMESGSSHQVKQGRKKPSLPTRNGLTTWDFKDLPARISVPTGTGADKLYFPTLSVNDQGQVDLQYKADEQKARLQNRLGMEFIYCLQFPGCRKQIRKECKTALASHSASWLSLGMKGTALELREALLQFVMDALFDTRDGRIPDQARFNAIIAELKKQGIHRKVQAVIGNLMDTIALRRRVTADLTAWTNRCRKNKCYNREIEQDFIQCLENILPPDFLLTRSNEQMLHTGRYLQALAIRLQRAEQEPAKDAQKQQRLTIAVNRLAHIREFSTHNPECRKAIALYRTMVEEFRVSVFAPEVGTAMPVSEKRLKKLWQELENTCRQVE